MKEFRFNPDVYEHLIGTEWIDDNGMGHIFTLTGIMLTDDDWYWVMTRKGKFNKHTTLLSCACEIETYGFEQKYLSAIDEWELDMQYREETADEEMFNEYDTTPSLVNFADGVDGHYSIKRYNHDKQCTEYFSQDVGWCSAGDVFNLGKDYHKEEIETKEKMAKALVICGYAQKWMYDEKTDNFEYRDRIWVMVSNDWELFDLSILDTVRGYKQANALEDWLWNTYDDLWLESIKHAFDDGEGQHQWRLDRIKWCFDQLPMTVFNSLLMKNDSTN